MVTNKRKNLYIEARERKVALEELEEEGWEYVKDYADPKFIKVSSYSFTHINSSNTQRQTLYVSRPLLSYALCSRR